MLGDTRTSRDAVLDLLRREPGLHLREIPRRLGISLGAARHHLAALAHAEYVVHVRYGRFVRWFPREGLASSEFTLISALRIRPQREILMSLLARGPSRFSDLRAGTGMPPSVLARGIRQLVARGLVVTGDARRYEVADPGFVRLHVDRYRATFPDLLADAARTIFEV